MFLCSKEPSHRDGSFEYRQHMFPLRNKKNNFQLRTFIRRSACLSFEDVGFYFLFLSKLAMIVDLIYFYYV